MIISLKVGGGGITGSTFNRTVNDSSVTLCGGTGWDYGASITLSGKDRTNDNGDVIIRTKDNSNVSDFVLRPNGTATWCNKNLAMQEDFIPRSGGSVITGAWLGTTFNNNALSIIGGTEWNKGGTIYLNGKDRSILAGAVCLRASDGTNAKEAQFYTDGTIQLDFMDIHRETTNGSLALRSGTIWENGASIFMAGGTRDSDPGIIAIQPAISINNYRKMSLYPSGTWTWNGTACQITSDQKLKQQITQIDNALLDAWEDVNLVQFKYNDAVETKGTKARLHTGYVVQQIDSACKSHNVDISEYGLYCHEEYHERTEEVEVTQDDGSIKKETKVIEEASEHYSLRYTETLVVECAYLRRENSRLKERLSKIEKLLSI